MLGLQVSVKRKFRLALTVVVILGSYAAWAKLSSSQGDQKVTYTPSHKECFSITGERPWKYCVHTPVDASTNGSVAYLLHGRNLDENTWNDDTFYTAMIQNYWQSRKISPPIVVTVSFGPVWLLTPAGQKQKSGLSDVFIKDVIPEVEKRIGTPKNRILFGESMGGLNSLLLGLNAPGLFHKVASLCPGLYVGSPFDSLSDIQAFLKRTGADPKVVYGIIQLSKDYFADDSEWQKSSPLKQIEQVNPGTAPEIYLSCGLYDNYGNFEGSEKFAMRAQERGFQITWRPIYGGHCATDVSSLAEFLAK